MDAAGIGWTILSAFRDDFRQDLVSGLKARVNNSFHGGSEATGGYRHGCAVDLASIDRLSDNKVWNWGDQKGREFDLFRPLRVADPAHTLPTAGWHELAAALRNQRLGISAEADPTDLGEVVTLEQYLCVRPLPPDSLPTGAQVAETARHGAASWKPSQVLRHEANSHGNGRLGPHPSLLAATSLKATRPPRSIDWTCHAVAYNRVRGSGATTNPTQSCLLRFCSARQKASPIPFETKARDLFSGPSKAAGHRRRGFHQLDVLMGAEVSKIVGVEFSLVDGFGCHVLGNGCSKLRSISPRKWLNRLAARAWSRTRRPTSILRSKAALVRLADVTNTTSSSATTALACSTLWFECSRIIIHVRASRSRPVRHPEPIRKSPHELFRCSRIAPSALNVEQQSYPQVRGRVHAPRQHLERLRAVEEGVGARQDRVVRGAEQFLVHTTSIAGVETRHRRTRPHYVRP
jgi:hypothetical protein